MTSTTDLKKRLERYGVTARGPVAQGRSVGEIAALEPDLAMAADVDASVVCGGVRNVPVSGNPATQGSGASCSSSAGTPVPLDGGDPDREPVDRLSGAAPFRLAPLRAGVLLAIGAVAGGLGLTAPSTAMATPINIGTGTTTISYTGSIVDYMIGTTGQYEITAVGGGGGGGDARAGGSGAIISGDFNLSTGDMLQILVGGGGGAGSYGYSGGGGGGGGSFVVDVTGTTTPLVIAGAGGGGGANTSGYGGESGTGGGNGYGRGYSSGPPLIIGYGGAGGFGGSGGTGGAQSSGCCAGGGGGGFTGNGGDGQSGGYGGSSFTNGGAGGAGGGGAGAGGFGGGGGGFRGGGGGGGYSGGGGGAGYYGGGGGGGGSFVATFATNVVRTAGNSNVYDVAGANGAVRFQFIPATTTVPEPDTLGLFAAGLLGLGALRRQRRRSPRDAAD